MEEAANHLRGPAEGGNRMETRRFTLQLGSMIVQWMVLLACVIGIALCYLKSPDPEPQWVYIKINLSGDTMKHIKREEGTIDILNQSIQVRCDGHYLFFLKGTVHLQQLNTPLMFRVKNSQNEQQKYLLDVPCSAQKTVIQQAMVAELRAQDKISLEANQTATSQDLSLFLIMLTPRSYCSPEKS